jgi:hypothetical protein
MGSWREIEKDKWGSRFSHVCVSCGGETFTVVREKEREKKHPGKRADRVAVMCANPECRDRKVRRSGWYIRRALAA